MSRKDEIFSTAEDFLAERLEKNGERLADYYIKRRKDITAVFIEHIHALSEITGEHQRTLGKAAGRYLHIACLRSSIMTGSHEFRLAMYSNKFYLDPIDTSVYWKADFLFQYVEQDIQDALTLIRRKVTGISDFEIKELTFKYAQCYCPVMAFFITELVQAAMEQIKWDCEMDKDFSVVFGGHMEQGATVYPEIKQEKAV